jgi:uncharacterized protein (DUF169 family)
MLSQRAKDLFEKLDLPYPPVAIKLHFSQPEGVPRTERKLTLCQYLKEAQDGGKRFFVTKEDESCVGKMVLGMVPKPPLAASGQVGFDFGVFRTQAANARIYNLITTLVPGAHNFVEFCPLSQCDFYPDLLLIVAKVSQADIIMRASSFISGDLWETKSTHVMSCAGLYAYPYVSGKINCCITGMHHGLKRRKLYPEGLHMISIPYQKLDEVITALDQMDWELLACREDEMSKAILSERMANWEKMSPDPVPKE